MKNLVYWISHRWKKGQWGASQNRKCNGYKRKVKKMNGEEHAVNYVSRRGVFLFLFFFRKQA